jgi:hypothetical protein
VRRKRIGLGTLLYLRISIYVPFRALDRGVLISSPDSVETEKLLIMQSTFLWDKNMQNGSIQLKAIVGSFKTGS